MAKKNKNKNVAKPEEVVETLVEEIQLEEVAKTPEELGDYVNEDGEVLMTEAEARAKIEAELREKIKEETLANKLDAAIQVLDNMNDEEFGKDDFFEFTVSGCYRDSRKETIDFDELKIKVPANEEEIAEMHVRRRYVIKAIKAAVKDNGEPKYPNRVERVRQVHIDDCRPCKGTYTFVGKNIKDLNNDELQDLATRKDLRFIPLPNAGLSKRDVLIRAYVDFAAKMFKEDVKWQDEKFNFAKLPPIVVDGRVRSEISSKITNEEMIEQEQNAPATQYGERDNPRKRFTTEELMAIADNKNIEYPEKISFDDLYNRLFSA